MCRRNQMRGCLLLGLGIGLLVAQLLESTFLCTWGGVVIIVMGACSLRRK